MNNDALFAALGVDAVVAVNGYRLDVISEAGRQGLRLVSEADSDVVQVFAEIGNADPIDIRLAFLHCPGHPELAGRTLRWVRRTAGRCPPRGERTVELLRRPLGFPTAPRAHGPGDRGMGDRCVRRPRDGAGGDRTRRRPGGDPPAAQIRPPATPPAGVRGVPAGCPSAFPGRAPAGPPISRR